MKALQGSAILAIYFTGALAAQSQAVFSGVTVTGQLAFARSVNLRQLAGVQSTATLRLFLPPEPPGKAIPLLHPPRATASALLSPTAAASASLAVNPLTKALGFLGLTHLDQK